MYLLAQVFFFWGGGIIALMVASSLHKQKLSFNFSLPSFIQKHAPVAVLNPVSVLEVLFGCKFNVTIDNRD